MRSELLALAVASSLALVPAATADEARTTFSTFGKGQGRAWRGPVPSADGPGLSLAAEGKPGTLELAAVPGADRYLVYLFDRARPVEKGGEEAFWKGESPGFVLGLEIVPRAGAKVVRLVDRNAARGWAAAWVFAVEAKERRAVAATWREDAPRDAGEDAFVLPNRYRVAGTGGER